MPSFKITFFWIFGPLEGGGRIFFKKSEFEFFYTNRPSDRALAALACLTKIPGDCSLDCTGLPEFLSGRPVLGCLVCWSKMIQFCKLFKILPMASKVPKSKIQGHFWDQPQILHRCQNLDFFSREYALPPWTDGWMMIIDYLKAHTLDIFSPRLRKYIVRGVTGLSKWRGREAKLSTTCSGVISTFLKGKFQCLALGIYLIIKWLKCPWLSFLTLPNVTYLQ